MNVILMNVILMNVILMNVILMNVILMNVILMNVILINVILMSVIAKSRMNPKCILPLMNLIQNPKMDSIQKLLDPIRVQSKNLKWISTRRWFNPNLFKSKMDSIQNNYTPKEIQSEMDPVLDQNG